MLETDTKGTTREGVFESIIRNLGEGVCGLDNEGRVTFLNPAAESMLGWKQTELLGKDLHEAVHFQRPALRRAVDGTLVPSHECPLRHAIRTGLRYSSEDDVFTRKDGSVFPVAYTASPIGSEDQVGGSVVAFRDNSERSRMEEELRRSRDQLQAVFHSVADGITVQDTSGRLIYANDAAARVTGYSSAQELLAASASDVLQRFRLEDEHGEPFPPERLPGRLALRGMESPETILGVQTRATGERRWSLVRATPVFDSHGDVQFAVNIFQDITERKHTEDIQQFLAQAGEVLSSSLDYETTLTSVARLTVPAIADWCSVDIVEENGDIRRLAVAHIDPHKVALAGELQERYPVDPDAPRGVPNVLRTGRSEFYPEISDAMLVGAARDAEHLQMLREVGMRSAMIVPLLARGRALGAISLVSAESGRRYTPSDLAVAEDLARRAAIAIDNARLYTERTRTEEALRESEMRFRTMIEQSPLSIQIFSPDGLTRQVNRAWEQLWGVTLDQIAGYNVLRDPQLVEKGIMRYIEEGFAGRPTAIPPVKYVPDVTITGVSDVGFRWVQAYIYPVTDPAGNIQEVVLVHEDVTDREWAQFELARSQASLAEAQRIAHLGSWEWDVLRDEDRWSDETYRIFGFSPQEFVPTYEIFLNLVHPDDREYVNRSVHEALYAGKPYAIEHRIALPDGSERVVHQQAEVVLDDAGSPVRMVGTTQDITERQRAAEQNSALLAQVQAALDLRNQFLSIASHELKTPVTLLKGYAQMLYRQAQQRDDAHLFKPLKVIDRQVERMTHLIDTLLDVSRIESGRLEFEMVPFELGAALAEVVGEVRISTPDFALRLEPAVEAFWVRGDRLRIQQVMTNLLINAVKYSDQHREADISMRRDGSRAVVSVTDYGIGIPKEQQPHVFELYFRGANASPSNYGGMGLGLFISKAIVERHGGVVWLESEVGAGSTFHFSLPVLEVEGRT